MSITSKPRIGRAVSMPLDVRLLRPQLHRFLGAFDGVAVVLEEPYGTTTLGRGSTKVHVRVHDVRFYRTALLGGNVGAGEAYMKGYWSTPDLTSLIRLFGRHQHVHARLDGGFSWLTKWWQRLHYRRRRNTVGNSRRNIAEHYDLSNEFFATFLDDTLSYSSGIYPRREASLDEAARHKLEVVCEKLRLGPRDHLLEIGTGWGGLAVYAARTRGCRVTTTTISRQQEIFARDLVQREQLDDRVTVLGADYRDLHGTFDKIVSIEMIEAVGAENYAAFFAQCDRLLAAGGSMLIQAILMPEQLYERSRKSVDFIKHFIFPGSCLPSLGAIVESLGRATRLQLVDVHDISEDYARTLAAWRHRFLQRRATVERLGFGPEFRRMWEYYLCYCEAGFTERVIRDAQLLLEKPAWTTGCSA